MLIGLGFLLVGGSESKRLARVRGGQGLTSDSRRGAGPDDRLWSLVIRTFHVIGELGLKATTMQYANNRL